MAVDRAARRLRSRTACPRRCRRPVRWRMRRRCRPRSRPARRGPPGVPRCSRRPRSACRTPAASAVSVSSSWCQVTVWVRRPSRNWSVASRARSSASAMPARRCAGVGVRTVHSRQALASAIRWPARLPLSTVETYCGSSGRRSLRVVPVVEMPAETGEAAHGGQRRLQPLDRFGGSQPGEVAGGRRREEIEAEIGRRGPVGQRRAPGPPGNCPAAACGRPPSRRSRRTARCAARSAAGPGRRPPIRTSGRRPAAAGWPSARSPARRSTARRAAPPGATCHARTAGRPAPPDTEDDPAGHHAIEAEQVEPGTDRRLGRRNPFEQMPAGDEQPHQGPRDRIAHQPRLMRQEGDDERRLGQAPCADRRRARRDGCAA